MAAAATSSGTRLATRLVVIVLGAGALWLAVEAALLWWGGELGLAAGATVAAVLLAAVAGMTALVVGDSLREKERVADIEARRVAFPDEPWQWRREWAEGRLRHEVPWAGAALLWGFAAVWSAFVVSAGVALHLEGRLQAEPGMTVVLAIFAVAGMFLLSLAVRATAHRLKYGVSVLELSSAPGVLGGELHAVLHPPRSLPPDAELAVALDCIRRVPRGTKQDLVRLEWRIERRATGGGGGAIPLSFEAPFDCPETTPDGSPDRARIEWTVKVSAHLPGVDYAAGFEVPLFRTPASDPSRLRGVVDDGDGSLREPPPTRIRVEPVAGGMTVRYPSPRWLTGCLLAMLAPPAVAGGIAWWSQQSGVDLLVTAGVGLGLGAAVLALTLVGVVTHLARIEVRPDEVRIVRGLGRLGWSSRIPGADIRGVVFDVSRSGRSPSYSVELETTGGRRPTVALGLRSEDEARWLTAELQRMLERR